MKPEEFARRGAEAQRAVDQVLEEHAPPATGFDERAHLIDLARTAGQIEAVRIEVFNGHQCVLVLPDPHTNPAFLGRYISAAHPGAILRLLGETPPSAPPALASQRFAKIRAQVATCQRHGLKSATVDVAELAALLDAAATALTPRGPLWMVQLHGSQRPWLWRIFRDDGRELGQGGADDALRLTEALNALHVDEPDPRGPAILAVVAQLRARVLEDGRALHQAEVDEGRGRHWDPFEQCAAPICLDMRAFLDATKPPEQGA